MRCRLLSAVVAALLVPGTGWAQQRVPIRVEQDIIFGKGGATELKLDLARPDNGAGPFPAVICLHGGGWVGGDRKQMAQTIEVLARRGYVAVTPDYRLAPRHRFPAPVEDCKAAVRWLRANAGKYKVDSGRIGAVGFSAGAHLACLLGVTDKADGLEGKGGNPEESSRVRAVVSFFGPTDLAQRVWSKEVEEKNLVPLLGGTLDQRPEAYRKASPLTYAGKGAAAFLFLHGTEDPVVPLRQAQDLADKLTKAGASARVIEVPGEGHGWRGPNLLWSLDQMLTFFDEKLKK